MPSKNKRIHDDDDEELDTRIDSAEDEDVPREEDDEPQKKGKARANGTGKGSGSKGKGKQLPETHEEEAGGGEDEDEIQGYKEQNSALRQEIAQLEELLWQSKRDADQAARPQATAGSGPSNTNKNQQSSSKKTRPVDTGNRPPNAGTGPSKTYKKPPFNAAPRSPGSKGSGKGKAGSADDNDDDKSERVPLPERKENLTIEAIRRHLGLSDSREDHLTWLEWRELIRTWSSMANLDPNLTWKQQDKGRVGTLITLICDRIPAFQRFVSNWGAEYLVQDCFNHRRGHRLSKARNPDRLKKKRRTTTTKTSNKASNCPKEGPEAPRSNKAPPRRPTPQPIPRPHPPLSTDTEQRTRGATNPPSSNRGTPPTGEHTEEQDDAHRDPRPNAGDGHRGRRSRGLDFGDCPPPSMNTRSQAKKNPPVEDDSNEEE